MMSGAGVAAKPSHARSGAIAANRRPSPVSARCEGTAMTGIGRASPSGDDSNLPDDERAMLERARVLIPRLAERAPAATASRQLPPRNDRRVSRFRHPADSAAAPLWRHAGTVQPVLPHRRGAELGLRLVGLGLCGAGRAPMDHRRNIRSGRRSTSGATIRLRSPRRRWRRAPRPSAFRAAAGD